MPTGSAELPGPFCEIGLFGQMLVVCPVFRDAVLCRLSRDQLPFARGINVNSGPLRQTELLGRLVRKASPASARGS